MTPQSILVLCILAFVVGCLVGHVLGFSVGVRRGRDAQWVDDFIEAGFRDRARRNHLGQFKGKERL